MRTPFGLFLLCCGLGISAIAAPPSGEGREVPRFTLQSAIEFALENNHAIEKEAERIRRETGVVVEVRALFLPSVGLDGSFEQTDSNRLANFGGASFGSESNWALNIELRQQIYAGGRNQARLQGQEAVLKATQARFETVVQQTVLDVQQHFFRVLFADSEIDVQAESVQLLEEELRDVRSRFEAGRLSEFNVLRAEVALANGRVPLIRARNQARLAREELARILSLPPSAFDNEKPPLEVVGEFEYQPIATDLPSLLVYARENRPELEELRFQITAREKQLKVAQRTLWPELAAFVGYGAENDFTSPSLGQTNRGWVAGVRGQWPIFDGFAARGRRIQASANLRETNLTRDQVVLDIEVEVRRALSELREADELVAASLQVVGQAEESVRLARARFDAGSATQLDVLDSQVALTEARTNKVRALFDYSLARARLQRAIGQTDRIEWR